MTPFSEVFEVFFSIITDDLYTIFDEKESEEDLILLLKQSIPRFEFPRESLNINLETSTFLRVITMEEINILGNIMAELWLKRHIFDQKLIEMEYGDKEFYMKSQSAHITTLKNLLKDERIELLHLQRLYNRRTKEGSPNYSGLAGK